MLLALHVHGIILNITWATSVTIKRTVRNLSNQSHPIWSRETGVPLVDSTHNGCGCHLRSCQKQCNFPNLFKHLDVLNDEAAADGDAIAIAIWAMSPWESKLSNSTTCHMAYDILPSCQLRHNPSTTQSISSYGLGKLYGPLLEESSRLKVFSSSSLVLEKDTVMNVCGGKWLLRLLFSFLVTISCVHQDECLIEVNKNRGNISQNRHERTYWDISFTSRYIYRGIYASLLHLKVQDRGCICRVIALESSQKCESAPKLASSAQIIRSGNRADYHIAAHDFMQELAVGFDIWCQMSGPWITFLCCRKGSDCVQLQLNCQWCNATSQLWLAGRLGSCRSFLKSILNVTRQIRLCICNPETKTTR